MDQVTEAAATWPDTGNLQWNLNHGDATTSAMNMDVYYSSSSHPTAQLKSTMPYLSGCSVAKRQGLASQDRVMQAPLSSPGANHSIVQYRHSEDVLWTARLRRELGLENASVGSCARQTQVDDIVHALPQRLQEAAHDMLRKFSKGSSKLPRIDRSPSIGSSGSLTHGGGIVSSSFNPGVFNAMTSRLPEGTLADVYFGKGSWIDETQIGPSERRSEQALVRQMRSTSQLQGADVSASATTRPRTRARRGQATDPHSIAERKRREKISNATKELHDLVPSLNKADRMTLVEDVIEYVRFLQLQTKVFIMSRLGSTGGVTPLVAETSTEGQSSLEAAPCALQDGSMAAIEEEVAKLMDDDDIGAALRFLQGKGLCLMPISLAASSKDAKQLTGFASAIE